MNTNTDNNIFARLRAPFSKNEIKWRVGSRTKDRTRGQALPYIDARAVMDRLDEVVGPENWSDSYRSTPHGVECTLSLRINGEWVSKSDCAQQDAFDEAAAATDVLAAQKREIAVKGAYSDAFKRAAVKWGIGRYLYSFEAPWLPLTANGTRFEVEPSMPAHLLPENERPRSRSSQPKAEASVSAPPQQRQKSANNPGPAKTPDPEKVFGDAWKVLREEQKTMIAALMQQIVACRDLDDAEDCVLDLEDVPDVIIARLLKAIEVRKKAAA